MDRNYTLTLRSTEKRKKALLECWKDKGMGETDSRIGVVG